MGIPIGKLALYTACGGIDPTTALPILLDVGTDNEDNLKDPLYVGWRHKRVRGADYDSFIEEFIGAVAERWPHVLLQWEDFAKSNATRLLDRYRDRLCSFNDDIQGTAAVATGALLAAINVTGVPMHEQRIAILGGGSAGCGIAKLLLSAMVDAGLDPKDAARRFYLVDKDGLLVEGMPDIAAFQQPFLQPRPALTGWATGNPNRISLLDVIFNAKPTALIGVSAQKGAFNESVVRAMAKHNKRPIVFPLSNPISCAEATPADIERWSKGRAVIGAGSPFPPIKRNGRDFSVDQTNNSYIFPGVGLGAIATHAKRISDGMFMAAAKALAGLSPARNDPAANLLPRVTALREVAIAVAIAVGKQAHAEGLTAGVAADGIEDAVRAKMWMPRYHPYLRAGATT
jgi:malate dehydrogenase (oxaloacetate-decarboxylating)